MSEDLDSHEVDSHVSKDSDLDDIDAPAIYTSDDDKVISPHKKRLNPGLQHPNSDIASVSSDPTDEPKITKKPRLGAAPSLVSYTIDEDDEATAPSDEDSSDAENRGSKEIVAVEEGEEAVIDSVMDTSTSPVATSDFPFISLDVPPTILSSDHQIPKEPIHIPSHDRLHNLPSVTENQDPIASVEVEANEELPKSQGTADEVQLPPEPPGHCRMELQEKVDREVLRMRLDISYDPNRAIQDNKAFRNPSIYEKLISFLNIDEKGTNFPQEIYDPYRWTSQSYYDELARVQNREIERLMKLQKEQKKSESGQQNNVTNSTNTQDMAGKNAAPSGVSIATGFIEPKKRSKWDAGLPEPTAPNRVTSEPPKTTTVPPVGSLVKQK